MSRAKEFRRLQSEVLEKEGFGKAEIQAIYLGAIADSLAAIADCLERLSDKDGEKIRQCLEALSSGADPDTISRQAAIDCVMECYDNDELFEVYEDKLRELPPAQPKLLQPWEVLAAQAVLPQPKMGKWIYHIDDLFPAESTMECNQCHAEQPLTCDDEFCPHCGAKMEVTI